MSNELDHYNYYYYLPYIFLYNIKLNISTVTQISMTKYLFKVAPNIAVGSTPITNYSYIDICTLQIFCQTNSERLLCMAITRISSNKRDHCQRSKMCSSNQYTPSSNKWVINKLSWLCKALISHKKGYFSIHRRWT